ncbi:V-set and immunoglobulin domain-containing protein 1-like [Antedon mediterranea]|uniref:V-set and immunoglobulin domain-containing protein 1-like n=1 Tax=Antedon mediterranea TaxID=105859 RepID=UPI003AF5558E
MQELNEFCSEDEQNLPGFVKGAVLIVAAYHPAAVLVFCSNVTVEIPSNQLATKGKPTILKCHYDPETVNGDIDISWSYVKSKQDITNIIVRNESKIEGYFLAANSFGDASLGIANVTESDAGIYVCEVVVIKTKRGSKASTRLNIIWNSVPNITQQPSGILQTGNSVILTCVTDSQPISIVTWSVNNRTIDGGNYKMEDTILKIDTLTREDHGSEIRCRSGNNASVLLSETLLLQVKHAPVINLSVTGNTLLCQVDAFPIATIIVYTNSSKYEEVELSYVKMDIDSCEHVTCEASNEVSSMITSQLVCGSAQKTDTEHKQGLSGGAVVGIVVSVIAISLLIAGFIILKKRNAFKYMRPTQRKDLDW